MPDPQPRLGRVKNTSRPPQVADLRDGRLLAPGAFADDVDVDAVQADIDGGVLTVPTTPKTPARTEPKGADQ